MMQARTTVEKRRRSGSEAHHGSESSPSIYQKQAYDHKEAQLAAPGTGDAPD
jgi:hypothetical protein